MTKKCMLKAFLMFSGGFTTATLLMRKAFKEKYEQIAKDEMNAYRDYITNQLGGELVQDEDIPENVVLSDATKGPDSDGRHADKVEYHVKASDYSENVTNLMAEKMGQKPYIINSEEYHTEDDFEKEELHYYAEDNALTDEQSDIIADVEYTVGRESLLVLTEDPETDVIYVRNETLHTDYMITCFQQSYSEAVLGFTND